MYLFVRSSTNPGPRVNRIINYLKKKGKVVKYTSPIRTGDKVSNSIDRAGDLGHYDYFDGSGYLAYLKFILNTNIKIVNSIFKSRKQIELVHFSDLESVLLGGIFCRVLGIKYIYNIHDNFFQRYEFNSFLSGFLKWLECLYIKLSDITLVPESFRAEAYPNSVQNKLSVFRNFPDFDVTTERLPFSDDEIRLFYGGWISPNRHIDLFVDLASHLVKSGLKIKVLMCGWGSSEYLEALSQEFNDIKADFEYLGQLGQAEAVDALKNCDISIAYYSPEKIINIYAASNKIPEILGSNTVLITNSQTEIARELVSYELSLQFTNGINEVFESLDKLIIDKSEAERIALNGKRYYMNNYNPNLMSETLEGIFNGYV